MADRRSGAAKPIAIPYLQPQTKPQMNTGRCMGQKLSDFQNLSR